MSGVPSCISQPNRLRHARERVLAQVTFGACRGWHPSATMKVLSCFAEHTRSLVRGSDVCVSLYDIGRLSNRGDSPAYKRNPGGAIVNLSSNWVCEIEQHNDLALYIVQSAGHLSLSAGILEPENN